MKASAWESLILAALLCCMVVRLDGTPQPSFDEGWALSVARNWIQAGHYGQMLGGNPTSASMLNIGFPAIAPMAFSFRLFGVGFWQGRIPSVFFSLGSIALLYWLARRLFGIRVAVATVVFLVVFLPAFSWVHPLLVGRQAIGEMPAMFYLLAGYAFFLLAFQKSPWFAIGCPICWGLATVTKLQGLPFLLAGLCVALFLSAVHKQKQSAKLVAFITAASVISFVLLRQVQNLLLNDTMLHQMHDGLFHTTACVWSLPARESALAAFIKAGLPLTISLLWKGRNWRVAFPGNDKDFGSGLVKAALFSQITAWLLWYLFLSVGWERYIFSPVFLGSIFVAASFAEWTSGFQRSAIFLVFHKNFKIVPAILLVLAIFCMELLSFIHFFISGKLL